VEVISTQGLRRKYRTSGGASHAGQKITPLGPQSFPAIDQTTGSGEDRFKIISAADSLESDLNPIWQGIGSSIDLFIGGAFNAVFAEAARKAGFLGQLVSGIFSTVLGQIVGRAFTNAIPFLGGGGGSLTSSAQSLVSVNATARSRSGSKNLNLSGVAIANGRELRIVLGNEDKFRQKVSY